VLFRHGSYRTGFALLLVSALLSIAIVFLASNLSLIRVSLRQVMVWKPKDFAFLLALSGCGRFYRRRFCRFSLIATTFKEADRSPAQYSNLLRRRDGFGRGECPRFPENGSTELVYLS